MSVEPPHSSLQGGCLRSVILRPTNGRFPGKNRSRPPRTLTVSERLFTTFAASTPAVLASVATFLLISTARCDTTATISSTSVSTGPSLEPSAPESGAAADDGPVPADTVAVESKGVGGSDEFGTCALAAESGVLFDGSMGGAESCLWTSGQRMAMASSGRGSS